MTQICCPDCQCPYFRPLHEGSRCDSCGARILLPPKDLFDLFDTGPRPIKARDATFGQRVALTPEELKDSGQKREFATGAHRDDDSKKPRYDLLPITALEKIAAHYAKGAAKYGENNWRKGIPRQEFLKSALRHTLQALRGDNDEDHVVHAAWNVLCFIETRELDLDKARI